MAFLSSLMSLKPIHRTRMQAMSLGMNATVRSIRPDRASLKMVFWPVTTSLRSLMFIFDTESMSVWLMLSAWLVMSTMLPSLTVVSGTEFLAACAAAIRLVLSSIKSIC